LTNLQLFVAAVAIWGTTWLAITYQLGRVAPEASVFYRFLLASALIFAYCLARKHRLRYPPRDQMWLALFGVAMFSIGYILIYYAEQYIVSGVVAVGYSASPLLGMIGLRICFGTPMTARMATGSILGILGITLVFWPEFANLQAGPNVALGAIFTAIAVVISTVGSLIAHRNHDAHIPIWPSLAWGMLYGALASLAAGLALGKELTVDLSPGYVISFLYLTVAGSIIAFGAYITLLTRIGAARSGYIGVMVPIVALVVSALFEGFKWHALTWAGIAVSVAGNVLVLRGKDA
jgi:drug/metabolite transporter (DMT)-like permease